MPIRKLQLTASQAHRGMRLDQVLAEWLPEALGKPVSKAKVRRLVVAGAVYLNSKRVRIASKPILPGARIEAHVDVDKLFSDSASQAPDFKMSPKLILFEDEHIVVVNKPPGVPTQPTLDEARGNLFGELKKLYPYVGLHHRLDRDTSGVILFTKRKEANAGVATMFSEHLAQKTYQALTLPPAKSDGKWPTEWSIKNFLGKVSQSGKQSRFGAVRSGGDPALTEFKLLEKCAGGWWVEAKPKTGRTHQIRVHLSEQGIPIIGDFLYGKRDPKWRLMLHAVSLTFPHPISNVEMTVQSPLPEDFNQCLQQLRNDGGAS